jgi:hypothetical protein
MSMPAPIKPLNLLLFSALLVPAAVLAQPAGSAGGKQPAAVPETVRAQIDGCAKYKFETIIDTNTDGTPRKQRVRLCGLAAKTDEDWRRTISEFIGKVEANGQLSSEAKAQIIDGLRAELARLDSAASVPVAPPPSVGATAQAAPSPQVPAASAASVRPPAATAAVRLSISCAEPGRAPEPCAEIGKDTALVVRSAEPLAGTASFQFLRRGEPRGEVQLSGLGSNQARRLALPRALCSGVSTSRVEVRVSGAGVAAQSLGPLPLRC